MISITSKSILIPDYMTCIVTMRHFGADSLAKYSEEETIGDGKLLRKSHSQSIQRSRRMAKQG